MRVVFMGTPDFAVPTLEAIIKEGHEVVAVYTQPDKAKGRGKAMAFPPVKEVALEHDLPVYQPVKIREESWVDGLSKMAPDVIVVVAFGQILPKAILDIPKYGCINVHASLLPKFRGAAPIQWAVINGEKETGVTTMYMGEGLDTGDMIMKTVIPLDEEETGGSLFDKLAPLGGELLIKTLNALEDGTAIRTPQDDSQTGEYAKMLTKTMGEIDFSKDAASIERLIRGLNPWPSAYTHFRGKTLKIWKAKVVDVEAGVEPGTICAIEKDGFVIASGAGGLKILELQLEGKKRMTSDAFMRGNSLTIGEHL